MTMTMEHPNSRHLGGMGFDHMPYGNNPHFTNPWASGTSNGQMYPASLGSHNMGFDSIAKQAQRSSTTSLPYSSVPATAPLAAGTGFPSSQFASSDLVNLSHDLLNQPQQGYSAAPSSVGTYAPTSQSQSTFSDALDASRGMVALSGQDITTPRNIYDTQQHEREQDGYGFPVSHSSHSSISGASYNGSYPSYAGSVDSSVSDYGSQSDLESVASRTLPRPSGLIPPAAAPGLPPPQSMMGQFNSKVSSSTQKKHKCKICDKRFTRPSSLQTHMYSHTGEKPFACEAEGCGRHFSVVSNLRRHRKVHKGEGSGDHESPEGSWASSDK